MEHLDYYELTSQESDQLGRHGKYDGWWASFFLFAIIFGPETKAFDVLPPIRFVDFVIVVLLVLKWAHSLRSREGFLFSPGVRMLNVYLFTLAFLVLLSILINTGAGGISYSVKNFFFPIAMIRLALIATIMASFNFGDRQVRQFAKGILLLSTISVILAFAQKFRPWSVSGLVETFYAVDWRRLDIQTKGVASRTVGTFGNPNHFSLCLVVLVVGSLAITVTRQGILRLFGLMSYMCLGAALLITTGSRTGFIAYILITGILLVLSLKGRGKILVAGLMVFMVILFTFVYANIDQLPINPRMKAVLGAGEGRSLDRAMQSRYALWRDGLREARRSLLLGVGASKTVIQTTDNGYIMMLRRN